MKKNRNMNERTTSVTLPSESDTWQIYSISLMLMRECALLLKSGVLLNVCSGALKPLPLPITHCSRLVEL